LEFIISKKGANQRDSVCIYDRAGSSIAEAKTDDFDWDEIVNDADWFHFTGITPALSADVFMICKEACIAAKAKGITVSCDLNYRSKLWSQEVAKAAMSELCSYVDICIANEEDAKNVFGIEVDNTNVYEGKINKVGYKDVAEKMKECFAFKYIAFTLRTSYSATTNDWTGMLYDGEQFYYAKEYHISNIVDRVGGGDSFGAGLIYGFRKGYDCQKTI